MSSPYQADHSKIIAPSAATSIATIHARQETARPAGSRVNSHQTSVNVPENGTKVSLANAPIIPIGGSRNQRPADIAQASANIRQASPESTKPLRRKFGTAK